MAGRVDLIEASGAVQEAMVAAAELSCVHRDIAEQEPDLTGSARALAAWIREAGGVNGDRKVGDIDDDVALVSPSDVRANRAVKLPDVLRESLVADAEQLVDVSEVAMSASGALAGIVRGPVDQAQGCPRCLPEEKLGRPPGGQGRAPTAPRR